MDFLSLLDFRFFDKLFLQRIDELILLLYDLLLPFQVVLVHFKLTFEDCRKLCGHIAPE